MLRSLFRTSALFTFFLVLLPGVPQAQSPSGLIYDEIARVVPSDATPPPPDAFERDRAALLAAMSGAPPAARKRGFFGGSRADDSLARLPQLGRFGVLLAPFVPGRLEQHAFLNGWERVDDPLAKRATIYKCDANEIIQLDLERKRYRIATPPPDEAVPEAQGSGSGAYARDAVALGTQTIDGLQSEGFASVDRIAMTDAQGSCSGGMLSATTQTYYAAIREPRRVCPVRRPAIPPAPISWVGHEGCTPTLRIRTTGPVEPVGLLALFRLQRIGSTLAGAPAPFGFLVERGNVRALDSAARAQFEVPPGFTKDS